MEEKAEEEEETKQELQEEIDTLEAHMEEKAREEEEAKQELREDIEEQRDVSWSLRKTIRYLERVEASTNKRDLRCRRRWVDWKRTLLLRKLAFKRRLGIGVGIKLALRSRRTPLIFIVEWNIRLRLKRVCAR